MFYEVIARVIANRLRLVYFFDPRLRPVSESFISIFQNAFVQERFFFFPNDILLAHDSSEYIRHKKKGDKSCFASQLDMSKAYD